VFGVEGEGFWSGIKQSETTKVLNSDGSVFNTFGSSLKNDSDFSVAGRLGIAFNRTLVYGKGGWAWGSHKFNAFDTCCNGSPTPTSLSASGNLDGMLVGVGIEHMLMRNITIKFEYERIAFGTKELVLTACNSSNFCAPVGTTSFSTTKNIFKVGANYLFNIGGM